MGKDIILKTIFGSHLYGTNTPESDKDYKVIYVPSKREILLNKNLYTSKWEKTKIGDGKNTKDDIDIEYIPLHQFIKLACQGDTLAMDLLHVQEDLIMEKNYIWDEIQQRRKTFYTKNLKAFIGYARKQAAKYGIKGSRLDTCKKIMCILCSVDGNNRVKTIWDKLPNIEHTEKSVNKNNIREYQVCGRKIQETQSCEYAYDIIRRYYHEYGLRAKQAANNENIDWKAISHALRAAFEVLSIYNKGTIKFPLEQKDYLVDIKLGKLDYLQVVAPHLESLIEEIELRSTEIDLPEDVNKEYWYAWLYKTIENHYWSKDWNPGISTGGI